MGREECKGKYVMANLPPRSPSPEIIEEENLYLYDVDMKDEVVPCQYDFPHDNTIPTMEFANPSVELGGIDVAILNPVENEKKPYSKDLYFFFCFHFGLKPRLVMG